MIQQIRNLFAAVAVFAATSVPTLAFAVGEDFGRTGVDVPELDPTSATSAVVLLLGAALLMHRSRRRA